MSAQYSTISALVQEIKQLCSQSAAGTLFITTSENKSAQLVLEHGQLVGAFYGRVQGEGAVKNLVESGGFRFRFHSGSISRRSPMPPTREVLSFLDRYIGNDSAPLQEQAVAGEALVREEKELLVQLLAISIGPMAEILAAEHLSVAVNADDAIKRLAKEIPSAEQAQVFRDDATTRIESMRTARTTSKKSPAERGGALSNVLGSGLGYAMASVISGR